MYPRQTARASDLDRGRILNRGGASLLASVREENDVTGATCQAGVTQPVISAVQNSSGEGWMGWGICVLTLL